MWLRSPDREVAAMITKIVKSMTKDATHWSVRLVAEGTGISKEHGCPLLRPHRSSTTSVEEELIARIKSFVDNYNVQCPSLDVHSSAAVVVEPRDAGDATTDSKLAKLERLSIAISGTRH